MIDLPLNAVHAIESDASWLTHVPVLVLVGKPSWSQSSEIG